MTVFLGWEIKEKGFLVPFIFENKMTSPSIFVIINVPSCLSKKVQQYLNFPVGWLSGQKQRSVKPSGYALHRFESYSYQKFKPRKGLYFLGVPRYQPPPSKTFLPYFCVTKQHFKNIILSS